MQISTNFHGFYLIFTQFSIKTRIFYCILFSFRYEPFFLLCKTNKSAFDFFTKSRIGFQSRFREDSIFRQKATIGFVFRSRKLPPKTTQIPFSAPLRNARDTPRKSSLFSASESRRMPAEPSETRDSPIHSHIHIHIHINIHIHVHIHIHIGFFRLRSVFDTVFFSPSFGSADLPQNRIGKGIRAECPPSPCLPDPPSRLS